MRFLISVGLLAAIVVMAEAIGDWDRRPQKFAPAPYEKCVEENTDYGGTNSGNEIPCNWNCDEAAWLKGTKAANWEGCAKMCHENQACRYWTYNPHVKAAPDSQDGTCYLKYYNRNKKYAAGVFSGTTDCVGPNYTPPTTTPPPKSNGPIEFVLI